MAIIGITGSIATGKSTFTRLLLQRMGGDSFDCDAEARRLLDSDPAVSSEILASFGAEYVDPDGKPIRARIRELVFADREARARLEAILHPRIRFVWTHAAAVHRETHSSYLVDIPLLFETQADGEFDARVVVACSPATQRHRLESGRGLDPQLAERMIRAQMPMLEKIRRGTHVVWNEGSIETLRLQAHFFASSFSAHV